MLLLRQADPGYCTDYRKVFAVMAIHKHSWKDVVHKSSSLGFLEAASSPDCGPLSGEIRGQNLLFIGSVLKNKPQTGQVAGSPVLFDLPEGK